MLETSLIIYFCFALIAFTVLSLAASWAIVLHQLREQEKFRVQSKAWRKP